MDEQCLVVTNEGFAPPSEALTPMLGLVDAEHSVLPPAPAATPAPVAGSCSRGGYEVEEWFGLPQPGEYVLIGRRGPAKRWASEQNVRTGQGKVQHIYYHVCIPRGDKREVYLSPGDVVILAGSPTGRQRLYLATVTQNGCPTHLLVSLEDGTGGELVLPEVVVAVAAPIAPVNLRRVQGFIEEWLST